MYQLDYENSVIGKTYGALTVKEVRVSERTKAICLCNTCGKTNVVKRVDDLRSGRVDACSNKCTRKFRQTPGRFGHENNGWKGYEQISGHYYSTIKKDARRRKKEFALSVEYLWDLFVSQNKRCKLTGVEIYFKRCGRNQTASLDRIDSAKGYVEGNVQWVHKDINLMKQYLEQSYFIYLCGQIWNHNQSLESIAA